MSLVQATWISSINPWPKTHVKTTFGQLGDLDNNTFKYKQKQTDNQWNELGIRAKKKFHVDNSANNLATLILLEVQS